jgi:ribosomal-protein-alanine N-acetyltransferase
MQLIARSRDEVLATLEVLTPEVRAYLSPQWLALLAASSPQDPWVHGFNIVNDTGLAVGICAFKGPPTEGVVEIAYAVNPEQQRRGYATAAARALIGYAFGSGLVGTVRAHTLPDGVASQRVLLKCKFHQFGEVQDPEDGLVWRYEMSRRWMSDSVTE